MIHCPELSEENVARYWQMNHNTKSTACKKRGGGVCGEHNLDLRVVKYSLEYFFSLFLNVAPGQ